MRYREHEDRFDGALMETCGVLDCVKVKRDALRRVLADFWGRFTTAICKEGVQRGLETKENDQSDNDRDEFRGVMDFSFRYFVIECWQV